MFWVIVLVNTGFVDWYDNWDILPMFVTHAYDSFPEVDKAKFFGLKDHETMDETNIIIVFLDF